MPNLRHYGSALQPQHNDLPATITLLGSAPIWNALENDAFLLSIMLLLLVGVDLRSTMLLGRHKHLDIRIADSATF